MSDFINICFNVHICFLDSRHKWWCWSKNVQELVPKHYGRGKNDTEGERLRNCKAGDTTSRDRAISPELFCYKDFVKF